MSCCRYCRRQPVPRHCRAEGRRQKLNAQRGVCLSADRHHLHQGRDDGRPGVPDPDVHAAVDAGDSSLAATSVIALLVLTLHDVLFQLRLLCSPSQMLYQLLYQLDARQCDNLRLAAGREVVPDNTHAVCRVPRTVQRVFCPDTCGLHSHRTPPAAGQDVRQAMVRHDQRCSLSMMCHAACVALHMHCLCKPCAR